MATPMRGSGHEGIQANDHGDGAGCQSRIAAPCRRRDPVLVSHTMKRIVPILISSVVILLLLGYFLVIRVPSGAIGIADTGRPGEAPSILEPGLHLHPAGAKVASYSTLPATANGEALVTPASGGEIPSRFSVTARVDAAHAAELH